jgi:hypothetical protein
MKIGDSPFVRGIAIIGVALFALYVVGTWDEGVEAPLQVPTALQGVRLGEQLSAFASSHGPFDKKPQRPETTKQYVDEEDYVQRNGRLHLGVRKGLVTSVAYACRGGRDRTALNNVACHSDPERIKSVFGNRVRVLCAKVRENDPNRELARVARAYDVLDYATRYIVIQDQVTDFIVYPLGELETLVGLNWERCR